jgi:hypothetical protein
LGTADLWVSPELGRGGCTAFDEVFLFADDRLADAPRGERGVAELPDGFSCGWGLSAPHAEGLTSLEEPRSVTL